MGVDLLEKTLSEGQLEDHQKINAQASLGNALLVFGDIRRSIECLQEVRKSRERVSGEHEVAMTESSLGVHLRIYGDYIESEKIGDEAQRRLNRLYPDDNFLVRNSYVQFVPSLMHRGDYPKADLLLRKLESVPENVATHQGSLLSSTFLWRGIYFLRLFRPSLAVLNLRKALDVASQNYGSAQHNQTCDYRIILASALIADDSLHEAEEQLRCVEENYASRSFVGPLSWGDFLLVKSELAIARRDFEAASQHAQAGLDQLADRLLPTCVLLAELQTLKAEAMIGLHRHEESRELLEQASQTRRQSQPEDHPAFVHLYEAFAELEAADGNAARSDEFHAKANAIQDKWDKFLAERTTVGEGQPAGALNPYSVTTAR